MSSQNRLTRSVPYWALVIVSVLTLAGGVALAVPRIGTMEEMLLAGTATGVEVYVGQAWITLAAGLVGAGAVGVLLALALAAAKALVPVRPAIVETIDWEAEGEEDADPSDPVVETEPEPVVEAEPASVPQREDAEAEPRVAPPASR
ncbi:hypothetical protein N8K70_10100 [Microbacterium betulae]|uniref:Dinucleotide-utilizing enzyme n=1 Tax=Microbacterium betulae TaxID=2981139 RepID=A0AA97FFM3_9MICO|nr:hypothetical protein [Microbacterium sp. AB]WOF21738.1 hypothetical protein N8K70_10100 [Microbacterium sp. AB]